MGGGRGWKQGVLWWVGITLRMILVYARNQSTPDPVLWLRQSQNKMLRLFWETIVVHIMVTRPNDGSDFYA